MFSVWKRSKVEKQALDSSIPNEIKEVTPINNAVRHISNANQMKVKLSPDLVITERGNLQRSNLQFMEKQTQSCVTHR